MRKFQATTLVLGIFIAIFIVLHWSEARDERLDTAMTAYESCVEREYGRTVQSYLAEHGEMPECEISS